MSGPAGGPNPLPNGTGTASGRVVFGTCGWSDDSILRCGRFYPAWVKTAEQRLEVYSRHFPCVEVDSSTYAIPRPAVTAAWAARVPAGFTFHFKAFGLFCHRQCPLSALPAEVKQALQQRQEQLGRSGGGGGIGGGGIGGGGGPSTVTLAQLGPDGEAAVWAVFHSCLDPIMRAGRMGAVVFQFQLNFRPGAESRSYVEDCRRRLDPRVPMAVEFRNRSWFADPAAAAATRSWLASLGPLGGAVLVAADELRHETYGNRSSSGAAAAATAVGMYGGGGRAAGDDAGPAAASPGQQRPEVLPIALEVSDPRFAYVRLHRREGTRERLLQPAEAQAWSERLSRLVPQLSGPAYFLIGTDWEDAPVANAALLTSALPPHLRLDWRAQLAAAAAGRRGTISAMFAAAAAAGGSKVRPAALPAAAAAAKEGDAGGAKRGAVGDDAGGGGGGGGAMVAAAAMILSEPGGGQVGDGARVAVDASCGDPCDVDPPSAGASEPASCPSGSAPDKEGLKGAAMTDGHTDPTAATAGAGLAPGAATMMRVSTEAPATAVRGEAEAEAAVLAAPPAAPAEAGSVEAARAGCRAADVLRGSGSCPAPVIAPAPGKPAPSIAPGREKPDTHVRAADPRKAAGAPASKAARATKSAAPGAAAAAAAAAAAGAGGRGGAGGAPKRTLRDFFSSPRASPSSSPPLLSSGAARQQQQQPTSFRPLGGGGGAGGAVAAAACVPAGVTGGGGGGVGDGGDGGGGPVEAAPGGGTGQWDESALAQPGKRAREAS